MSKMKLCFLWLTVLTVLNCMPPCFSSPNKVILILMDGFRWDYFDMNLHIPGFTKIMKEGTKAEYMDSTFPTVSYTNYVSIASGLWPETHGMIANYVYDPDTDETFWIGSKPEDFQHHWFKDSEPIWVTAEKENKKTMMLYWPGCSVNFNGVQPSYFEEWTTMPLMVNFTWAIDTTLEAMRKDQVQMSGIYFEMTDHYGHRWAPALNDTIELADAEILRMLTYLEQTDMADGSGKMADFVNVIIVSDHGMHELPKTNIVDLDAYVNADDVLRFIGPKYQPVSQLWPKEGREELVYESLRQAEHMTTYKKADIPDRWHLKNNKRVPPLLLVADGDWHIKEIGWNESQKYPANHGYPPEMPDMRAIFVAWGPDISQNHVQEHFVNIEVYQLLCALLGVKSAPNNGTWQNISGVLRASAATNHGCDFLCIILAAVILNFISRH